MSGAQSALCIENCRQIVFDLPDTLHLTRCGRIRNLNVFDRLKENSIQGQTFPRCKFKMYTGCNTFQHMCCLKLSIE